MVDRSELSLIALFIVCLIFWITGAYVFFKRPKNLAAQLLCLCWMGVGLVLSANMAALRAIPAAAFFEVFATIIGPWMLLHFFIILPEERKGIINNPLHISYLYFTSYNIDTIPVYSVSLMDNLCLDSAISDFWNMESDFWR